MKTEAYLLRAIAEKCHRARPVPTKEGSGGGAGGDGGEKFQYFYHPDHLGSTSYITDASGEVYQHFETEERGSQTPIKIIHISEQYFAFGGAFVEEHSNTNRTPYLFNGKELDEETGLYYYGARYYDEQTSVWLSVDPLSDKYPGLSPFVYVANNPLIFVDPDGMRIKGVVVVINKDGSKTLDFSKASKSARTILGAMTKTETGLKSAISLAETKTNVKLKLSNWKSPDGGSYAETKESNELNDDGTYKDATITLYKGEFNADKASKQGKFGDKDSTEDEFFNVISVHEEVHLQPEQIKKDDRFSGKIETEEQYKEYMQGAEGEPHKAEVKTRKEYRSKYGGSDSWKDSYRENYIKVDGE